MEERILAKLDDVQSDVRATREEMRVEFAKLPHSYVPRSEVRRLQREASAARRWAIALGVPSIVGIAGILIQVF